MVLRIPHICHFWYTTALSRPEKVKLAKKGQNFTFSMPTSTLAGKKVQVVTNMSLGFTLILVVLRVLWAHFLKTESALFACLHFRKDKDKDQSKHQINYHHRR